MTPLYVMNACAYFTVPDLAAVTISQYHLHIHIHPCRVAIMLSKLMH